MRIYSILDLPAEERYVMDQLYLNKEIDKAKFLLIGSSYELGFMQDILSKFKYEHIATCDVRSLISDQGNEIFGYYLLI